MIKLDNISKYYYSSSAVVPALRNIKLELSIGEFVAITGESGSGKSTLLNLISGLDTYDDGELYINGEATSHFDAYDWEEYRKNRVGFVFQNYNLIENYSALYNVESSLLIQGCSNKEAKQKAKELLKRVGLVSQMHQRASRLSSGQKQRLSIARALAKDTDIIVADEPTGNLDSESGKMIMELFSELSKDKLIIVVTHNFEEAAPYVTRKVRLHDGEIVSDTCINRSEIVSQDKSEAIKENRTAKHGAPVKSDRLTAWRFALMNITTLPRRVVFYLWFLVLTAAVSFIFLGEIFSNLDDTFTKEYDNKAFYNGDTRRIVVTKPDSSELTAADMDLFRSIKYVEMVDRYDYSNDINYYIIPGRDYDYRYNPSSTGEESEQSRIVNFLKQDKFMKSVTCISEENLAAGRLPRDRNEAVIYSKSSKALGSEQICYFTNQNSWGYNQYYTTRIKVVGLLKKKSSQVYFSEELCNMLSLSLYSDSYDMHLCWNKTNRKYEIETAFIPVIGEDLDYGELRISGDLVVPHSMTLAGDSEVVMYRGGDYNNYQQLLDFDTVVLKQANPHSAKFVEMNRDWFYELYRHRSSQAALYINDYIHTDYVLHQLTDRGYKAISSFRLGSVAYNPWKVTERLVIILRSLFVLLVLGILEILIMRSILKIKLRDYMILVSLGMNRKTINILNYFEMFLYTILAVAINSAAMNIINLFRFDYLSNMVKYYNVLNYSVYIAFNMTVIATTVYSFNRYLKRKRKWS